MIIKHSIICPSPRQYLSEKTRQQNWRSRQDCHYNLLILFLYIQVLITSTAWRSRIFDEPDDGRL